MHIDGIEFSTKKELIEYVIDTYTFRGYTCPSTLAHNIPFVFSTKEELTEHMLNHAVFEIKNPSDLSITEIKLLIEETIILPIETTSSIDTPKTEKVEDYYTEPKLTVISSGSIKDIEPIVELDIKSLYPSSDNIETDFKPSLPFICAKCLREDHLKCTAKTCDCNHIQHFDQETIDGIKSSLNSNDFEIAVATRQYLDRENISGLFVCCSSKDCLELIQAEIPEFLCSLHQEIDTV